MKNQEVSPYIPGETSESNFSWLQELLLQFSSCGELTADSASLCDIMLILLWENNLKAQVSYISTPQFITFHRGKYISTSQNIFNNQYRNNKNNTMQLFLHTKKKNITLTLNNLFKVMKENSVNMQHLNTR